jgi:hypothetical protein
MIGRLARRCGLGYLTALVAAAALIRFDLGGRKRGDPVASKTVKITDVVVQTTATTPGGSPEDTHQAAMFALGRLVFLGMGLSSRGSSACVAGVTPVSTSTSWLSVTLASVIL